MKKTISVLVENQAGVLNRITSLFSRRAFNIDSLAVGVTAGLPREQALKLATYTAALTVSRMGAMPSLPTLDEVLALMAERGCEDVDLSRLAVLR